MSIRIITLYTRLDNMIVKQDALVEKFEKLY